MKTIILFLLFLNNFLIAQDEGIIFDYGVPAVVDQNATITLHFTVDTYNVWKYRFKLITPKLWERTHAFAINNWSDWRSRKNEENVTYEKLYQTGKYKFVVEYFDFHQNHFKIEKSFVVKPSASYSNDNNYYKTSNPYNKSSAVNIYRTTEICDVHIMPREIFVPKTWFRKKSAKQKISSGIDYAFSISEGMTNYVVIDLVADKYQGVPSINAKRGVFVFLFPKEARLQKENIKVEWIDKNGQVINGASLQGFEDITLWGMKKITKWLTGMDIAGYAEKKFKKLHAGELEEISLPEHFYQFEKYNVYFVSWESTFNKGMQISSPIRRIKIAFNDNTRKIKNLIKRKDFAFFDFFDPNIAGGNIAVAHPLLAKADNNQKYFEDKGGITETRDVYANENYYVGDHFDFMDLFKKNAMAINNKNVDEYMSTIHPNSPYYFSIKEYFTKNFSSGNKQVKLNMVKITYKSSSICYVTLIQTSYDINLSNSETVERIDELRRYKGDWKIYKINFHK